MPKNTHWETDCFGNIIWRLSRITQLSGFSCHLYLNVDSCNQHFKRYISCTYVFDVFFNMCLCYFIILFCLTIKYYLTIKYHCLLIYYKIAYKKIVYRPFNILVSNQTRGQWRLFFSILHNRSEHIRTKRWQRTSILNIH